MPPRPRRKQPKQKEPEKQVPFALSVVGYATAVVGVPENMRFSETGSLLLDSQVPSSPQLCPWNLFLAQDCRLDRIRVRP